MHSGGRYFLEYQQQFQPDRRHEIVCEIPKFTRELAAMHNIEVANGTGIIDLINCVNGWVGTTY